MLAVPLGVIGGALFVGDWLFGSIGWGVLHGILTFTSVAVAAGLVAAGVTADRIGRSLFAGVIVAIAAAVVLGLGLPNRLYAVAGEAVRLNIEAGARPLAVGLLLGALVGLLLGFALAIRATTIGLRLATIVGCGVAGTLAGGFLAITFGPRVGVALGITFGYLSWMVLMGADVSRRRINMDRMKERFYPTQTIETAKETLEWLQKQMPRGPGS